MAKFTRYNWLVIVVIFLAIVNLASLGFIWFGRQGEMQERPKDAREFLIAELDMSSQQVKQFDSLRQIHFAEMEQHRQHMHRLKDALFDKIKDAEDSSAVHTAMEIGQIQTGIELSTFHHFQQLRSICNASQKQKFDKIIREVLRNMGPGPKGRPGPPPQGGPPKKFE